MKKNAVLRIVVFGLLAWGLCLLLNSLLHDSPSVEPTRFADAPIDRAVLTPASRFSPDAYDSIKIDWASGRIELVPTDGDEIKIYQATDGEEALPMSIQKDGCTLKIEQDTSSDWKWLLPKSKENTNLIIEFPREWSCRKLSIDAASASIYVEDLSALEVEIDAASSEIAFADCNLDKLDVDTASGQLAFNGWLNELDMSGASCKGNLVFANHPKAVKMDAMSGKLELTLPMDCSGYTVKLDGMSSQFSSEFDGEHTYGDGACKIDVDGMSTTLTILKGNYKAK